MSKVISAIAQIETPETAAKFVKLFQSVNNIKSENEARQFFEVEVFHFQKLIQENATLQECTELSSKSTFLEVISNGLTFEKSQNQVYLMPQAVNVGTKDAPKWERRMSWTMAKGGLEYVCRKAGSIKSVSNPILVYQGDNIDVSELGIKHTPAIPRKSDILLGGYCIVMLPDGSKEPFWFDISEVERLKRFSAKKNKGTVNELYSGDNGQIDAGFLKTKIVKAALANKPRKALTNVDNLVEISTVSQGYNEPEEMETYDDMEDAIKTKREIRTGLMF